LLMKRKYNVRRNSKISCRYMNWKNICSIYKVREIYRENA
jgi:hypothetical protein